VWRFALSDYVEIDIDFSIKHIIADNERLKNVLNFNSLANGA
jgi:hypothetical protein